MKQQMKQEYGDSSSYKNSAHATWQFVHDIKAVSYTHLDVYKRQIENSIDAESIELHPKLKEILLELRLDKDLFAHYYERIQKLLS